MIACLGFGFVVVYVVDVVCEAVKFGLPCLVRSIWLLCGLRTCCFVGYVAALVFCRLNVACIGWCALMLFILEYCYYRYICFAFICCVLFTQGVYCFKVAFCGSCLGALMVFVLCPVLFAG